MEALQGHGEDMLDPCTECGYLIECALGVRCSECGHVYETTDVAVAQRRRELLEDSVRYVKKAMGLWIGALALYVIGGLLALFVVDQQMPWDVVFGMVVGLVGLVVGSVVAGDLVALVEGIANDSSFVVEHRWIYGDWWCARTDWATDFGFC